jgi:hypothetical protein
MVEKRVVIGEMGVEGQIPCGNDRKKGKCRSNEPRAFVVSHPCPKCGDKGGAPAFVLGTGRQTPGARGVGICLEKRYRRADVVPVGDGKVEIWWMLVRELGLRVG